MAELRLLGDILKVEGIDEKYLEKLGKCVEDTYNALKEDESIVDTIILMKLTALNIANRYFMLLEEYENLQEKLEEKYDEIEKILKRIV